MQIGDGMTTLFWEDRWLFGLSIRKHAPSLYMCIPKHRRKSRTMAEGIAGNAWVRDIHGTLGHQEIGQYLQLWLLVSRTTLSSEPDKLSWKWTISGSYTTRSCYLATFHGSITCRSWKLI
ncbi:hypothetical protein ZWY2020_046561 [Hordeum vulgare]|nr:hypothetical protein ZWY2020_046561 [Hordeum vulgare]